ncbi:hypothetical protein V8E36_005132 [Tilletia maclaganii]
MVYIPRQKRGPPPKKPTAPIDPTIFNYHPSQVPETPEQRILTMIGAMAMPRKDWPAIADYERLKRKWKLWCVRWHSDRFPLSRRCTVGNQTVNATIQAMEHTWDACHTQFQRVNDDGFQRMTDVATGQWNNWKAAILREVEESKSEEQRQAEEAARVAKAKELEAKAKEQAEAEAARRSEENKERRAQKKAEKKAAAAKEREPWEALTVSEQQSYIQSKNTLKNQQKKFRKRTRKTAQKLNASKKPSS